ncbi:MAG: hypothetical protein A2Y76_07335 [Planctomycetes bacterium RBG_13_60_9]|nr:MAG: hypothetical protein A2Y76_07335 [Planctomycetes bacterium RBG_13_60_9]
MSKMNDAELRRRLERLADVQPSPEATKRAMDRVRRTILETEGQQAREGLGRILMNSTWSKLAVAAAVVAAVLIGLQFLGTSSITFAKAIQPILDANSAILDIIIGEEKEGVPVIHDMVMGARIRRTVSNIPNNVSVIDLKAGRILSLDETKKEAVYVDLKGLPSMPNYLDHLKNVLVVFQDSPSFTTESLGLQQIDGREAVGFHAKHPEMEVVLWADSKTGLPIRIEHEEGQLTVICKNLEFDVPMDPALFSMDAPEGYKQQTMAVDLFGSTEADFIEGLRLLAGTYGDGQFPDGVALEDFLKQAPAMQKKSETLGLSKEEETAQGATVQKYILFLRFFKGEGKWYYRGKGVKLGEADKAIFWYRPKGSATYRVIYGDLHVEDVAPENLPEPLDADDVPAAPAGYQQWSKPVFVGKQIDYWLILPEGKARVRAYLTLLKGPQDTTLMPVRLPYANAPLEAAIVGDPADPTARDIVDVPFHKTGDGTYNIELPIDKLTAGRNTIIFQWHVSLDDLTFERPYYITKLQSLVPVVSYHLQVGVDPNSGLELTGKPEGLWSSAFSQGRVDYPKTEFGTCGLPIQKRQ